MKMKFLKNVALSALAMGLAGTVYGATIDFTDGVFTTVTNSGINDEPTVFTETEDGVTFTFESTLNLVGTERFLGIRPGIASNGLQLGGGGGSTLEFTFSASEDITLISYSTDTGGFSLNTPTINVFGPLVASVGNTLVKGVAVNLFVGGPLLLTANTVYFFDVQGTGAAVQAYVASFDFTKASSAVPDAGSTAVLLCSGLLLIGAMKRVRKFR